MAASLVRRLETTKLMKGLADSYYADLKVARAQGRKVAWTVGIVPFQLMRCMDIAFQHLESYGAMVAARKVHGELKNVAHAANYSPEACSYARIAHGRRILESRGELDRMIPEVVYPTPDFIVGVYFCPTMLYVADSFARTFKVPLFAFELPVCSEDSQQEAIRTYWRDQLKRFIAFLEDVTGRPFNYDKLRECMTYTKKAATLRMKCIELGKVIPSPTTVFDMFIALGPINYLRGTPQSVQFYEKLLAEIEDRVANKVGAIPEERYRLYWDNLPIWFKVGELSEKLAALKANAVISQYTYHFWCRPEIINPDDPIETLVEEYVGAWSTDKALDLRVNLISRMVDEYSLDGLLVHSSRTCRPWDFGQHDIIDIIRKRTGVPGIMIDGDPTDPDYYSDAQVNTRLQAFMETLAARKAA